MAKTFDQFYAESGRQSELDDLRRSGRYDQAKASYEQGGSSFSGGNQNFGSILDQVKSSITGALDPIVNQIKGQAPAITEAYQGAKNTLQTQKSSLAGKYQQLLNDIRNTGQQKVNTQTVTTNDELARRGITSDSTSARQELSRNLDPIQQTIQSQTAQATQLQGEEEQALANAIANLGIQEQQAQGGILSQVAQLLSGGVNQATGLAGNIYSQMQSQQQTPQQISYQDLQNQLLQQQLSQSQAIAPLELQKIQAEVQKLLKGGSKSISLDALESLWD